MLGWAQTVLGGRGRGQAAGDPPRRLRVGTHWPRCGAASAGGRAVTLARLELEGSSAIDAALDRLVREDALGQLLDRRGRLAELATENGDVKLGWADHVAWALYHPAALDEVAELAASIRSRFDHV